MRFEQFALNASSWIEINPESVEAIIYPRVKDKQTCTLCLKSGRSFEVLAFGVDAYARLTANG